MAYRWSIPPLFVNLPHVDEIICIILVCPSKSIQIHIKFTRNLQWSYPISDCHESPTPKRVLAARLIGAPDSVPFPPHAFEATTMGATSDQWIKSTWSSSNPPFKDQQTVIFPSKMAIEIVSFPINSMVIFQSYGPRKIVFDKFTVLSNCYILLSFLGGMCHQVTWVCLRGPWHWSPHAIGNPNTMGESKFQMDWWLPCGKLT